MSSTTHLFCGGAGDMRGFAEAGLTPAFAANHDADSIATVRANFDGVPALQCDINNLDFRALPRTRVLVGSPICTEISPAGRRSASRSVSTLDAAELRPAPPEFSRTRATAWDLIRADEVHDYDLVVGENVLDFATRWPLFEAWLRVWDAAGKNANVVAVNAAHVAGDGVRAVPQLRDRLLFTLTRKGLPAPDLRPRVACICRECGPVTGVQVWAARFDRPGVRKVGAYGRQYRYVCPTARCHLPAEPVTEAIGPHIQADVPGRRLGDGLPGSGKPYCDATVRKIEAGYERYEGAPFLVILRRNATVTGLDEPIPTLTTGNHHLLVRPGERIADAEVRQLTPRERARAQGFPDHHEFAGGTTSARRQIGNAVPVNVARWTAGRIRPAVDLGVAA